MAEKLQKANNTSKKKELISNFYVPNTKEDIIEFFTLAVSQIDDYNECSEAWCSKLDQTLIKAKLSFGNTDEYRYLVKLYNDAKKNKKKVDARKYRKITIRIIASAILGIAGTVFMVIGTIGANKSGDPDSPLYMFFMVGFILYLAIGYVWLSLYSNKKKVTTVTTSKKGPSKKTIKVEKVEVESNDEDEVDEDEEDEEEIDDEDETEEDEDVDEEESEIEEEDKTTEVESRKTTNKSKSLKDEFKDIGKEFDKIFKDMFK